MKSFKGIAEVSAWQNRNGRENSVLFSLGNNINVLVSNTIVSSILFKSTGTNVPVSALVLARKASIEIEYEAHKKDETWTNTKSGATGVYTADGFHVEKLIAVSLPQATQDKILEHELRAQYIPTNASIDIDEAKPF